MRTGVSVGLATGLLLVAIEAAVAATRPALALNKPKTTAVAADAGAATNAAPEGFKSDAKVPAGWLKGPGPSGYEKAVELQKQSGLDMLVLFYREDPDDEKGLLRWFEKKGMSDVHVVKAMRGYVKVRIDASQHDPRTRDLAQEYKVGKTPWLAVRQPNGFTRRVGVFEWPNGKPDLVEPNELVKRLTAASSPSYQEKAEK